MQIGIVGLGRMGGNIALRLMRAGHRCVVFDRAAAPREALARQGAEAANTIADLVQGLEGQPKAVWLMLPAGKITEDMIDALTGLLAPGDIIIDGGNTYYKDDIRRARTLAAKEIHYIDCGTSGGGGGLARGFCLMSGGLGAAAAAPSSGPL